MLYKKIEYFNSFYNEYFIDDHEMKQGLYKIINTNGDLHTIGFLKDSFYEGVAKCYMLKNVSFFKTCKKQLIHGIFINFHK